LQAYDIFADDRALRAAPETFEALRGDYPIRREPHALQVAINQATSIELISFIEKLSYQVSGKPPA